MPTVIFRADASAAIGTGHIMRCLALANGLSRQHGSRAIFLVRHLPDTLSRLLGDNGHQVHFLPAGCTAADELAHSFWLGSGQAEDAEHCVQMCTELLGQGKRADWVVMDHYALDWRWQQPMRAVAHRMLVIDDLADRVHDCDVLIDANAYLEGKQRYAGKVPAHATLLLGTRYVLLRDEFVKARSRVKIRSGRVERLLVFFSGMDGNNHTGRLLGVLPSQLMPKIAVDVVIGAQHPERGAIEAACIQSGYRCHVQTPHMAALMAQADLAIGAGGSTVWERCSMGLPSMVFAIADNQIHLTRDAALQGLVESPQVDWSQPITVTTALQALVLNPLARERMSRLGLQMVDGQGMARVLRVLDG